MQPSAGTPHIAVLYDIHANLPALEAVVAEVRREGFDRIVIGGDVVPGPMPRETISSMTSAPTGGRGR